MALVYLIVSLAWHVRYAPQEPWVRHVIDDSLVGADGVRLGDVNGDGKLDVATAWEESGVIRIYLNPGPSRCRRPWPAVTVGRRDSPEDAVFADLDSDGIVDVISSCEGHQKCIFVHWGPRDPNAYADPQAWETAALAESEGAMQWMFALPVQVDGKRGIDLVAGGKKEHAQLGWFESPAYPRRLAEWRWHPFCEVGWVMSILPHDMDGDGDIDILASDRKGPSSGNFWLENPGPTEAVLKSWTRHDIGGSGMTVTFLTLADLDQDGKIDVVSTARPRWILYHRRLTQDGQSWQTYAIQMPPQAGISKGIKVADINLDGKNDIVFTCERAGEDKRGVMWISYRQHPTEPQWQEHDISGSKGRKYDLVELIDLDGDGDLDVLTTEETTNLGVIWYENPTR